MAASFKTTVSVCVILATLSAVTASADTFGTGGNQFNIDFVPISGATNPTSDYGIVNNDFRMGTYEITNNQWNKFKAAYGTVTGSYMGFDGGYAKDPYFTGESVPTNNASWYEAAQFVNWLNTSTGHQAAYKFTGTQGTSNYTPAIWSAAEADNGTNLYRHKDAMYYLPSEDEWVKAAYWNGTALQTFATKAGDTLHQGDGVGGTGWNYWDVYNGYATSPAGPWNVGSGSEELNGTFDMMGNIYEWMESSYGDPNFIYGHGASRTIRGAGYGYDAGMLSSGRRRYVPADGEYVIYGFRVASEVPEPASLGLLTLGGLALLKRKRRA